MPVVLHCVSRGQWLLPPAHLCGVCWVGAGPHHRPQAVGVWDSCEPLADVAACCATSSTLLQVLGDALRIKETPTNQLYQQFEEAGTDLAQVRCCQNCLRPPLLAPLFCLFAIPAASSCSHRRTHLHTCCEDRVCVPQTWAAPVQSVGHMLVIR